MSRGAPSRWPVWALVVLVVGVGIVVVARAGGPGAARSVLAMAERAPLSERAPALYTLGVAVLGAAAMARAKETAAKLALGGAVVVVAAGAVSFVPVSTPPSPPEDPPARTRFYRAAHNLHRAREAALAWAKQEPVPGPGYLNLAEIDWELGERDKARRVLAKAKERATDPAVQSRAATLELEWAAQEAAAASP